MATHEDMVCLHGEGTYVTATGLNCACCGGMLCKHGDQDEDDRPDEWRKTTGTGGRKVRPTNMHQTRSPKK